MIARSSWFNNTPLACPMLKELALNILSATANMNPYAQAGRMLANVLPRSVETTLQLKCTLTRGVQCDMQGSSVKATGGTSASATCCGAWNGY